MKCRCYACEIALLFYGLSKLPYRAIGPVAEPARGRASLPTSRGCIAPTASHTTHGKANHAAAAAVALGAANEVLRPVAAALSHRSTCRPRKNCSSAGAASPLKQRYKSAVKPAAAAGKLLPAIALCVSSCMCTTAGHQRLLCVSIPITNVIFPLLWPAHKAVSVHPASINARRYQSTLDAHPTDAYLAGW